MKLTTSALPQTTCAELLQERVRNMKRIKVMVIAPYEGLRETVAAVAPQFRERLDIVTTLGDRYTGGVQAKEAESQGYDILVSRGRTAEIIRQNVSIPVIDIEISGYDYMRAIKLAENIQGKKAFVGFTNITKRAESINALLRTNVDIFTVRSSEEISPLLKRLTAQGYELIIGDVATCREAEDLDIHCLLLTSGEESLTNAFENVITWTDSYETSTQQLHLLRQVVAASAEQVMVLQEDGDILYRSMTLAASGLSTQELMEFAKNGSFQDGREVVLPMEEKTLYVTFRRLTLNGMDCYVFYFREVLLQKNNTNTGITVRNFKAEPAGRDFVRQTSIYDQNVLQTARSFCASNRPILLTGDTGVGKTDMAVAIHRYSDRWMRPFVHVDCAMVDFESLASWLLQCGRTLREGATICFEYLESIDRRGQRRICEILKSMESEKWWFIATASPQIQQSAHNGDFDELLFRFFSQLSLYLPNLVQSHKDLQKIINLYIIEANIRLGRQITGLDEAALELVGRHHWQYNFAELQQAVYQMVLICEGPFIRAEDVRATLMAREIVPMGVSLSLDGSLEEIELRVIQKVLDEEKGNLSRTAERLQVGRSTLWRKLRKTDA